MKSPHLPGLPTVSALILAAVLVCWLGLWGPIDIEKIKAWQALIGGCVTAVGIFVAAHNVTRQMRIAARAREEDRIERDFAGLRAAHTLLLQLRPFTSERYDADAFLRAASRVGLTHDGLEILKDLETALPSTLDQVRREMTAALFPIINAARALEHLQKWIDEIDLIPDCNRTQAQRDNRIDYSRNFIETEASYRTHCQSLDAFIARFERGLLRARHRLLLLRRFHEEQLNLK